MLKPPKVRSWQGKGIIISVADGDTMHAGIDLGFGIELHTKLRVAGVQAPELATIGGSDATQFLAALCPPGSVVMVNSKRLDKYGRAEAVITLEDGRDLATEIINSGHGIPADDRTKPPV
jgi:endonuclease YncB( thermonuclease family)